ncbi:MAG: hypothetical protein JXB88_05885 [Spirochaetales bacterium]|nr:hypothetical protein [Spirochaetales bacterium]
MYNIVKYVGFLLLITLFSGCATSRLGYPVESVEIPTTVTLFSTIAKNSTLNNNLDIASRELFKLLYKKKYEKMMAQVSLGSLQNRLNNLFLEYAQKTTKLFTLDSEYVYNWDIEGSKIKDDKKALYSYNFSMYKDQIPSKYILALTIDEWGYAVEKSYEEDGPYISITIQLIDKDTNESLWGYNSMFHESTGKEGHGVINLEDIEEIYEKLIKKAVKRYFSRLRQK